VRSRNPVAQDDPGDPLVAPAGGGEHRAGKVDALEKCLSGDPVQGIVPPEVFRVEQAGGAGADRRRMNSTVGSVIIRQAGQLL